MLQNGMELCDDLNKNGPYRLVSFNTLSLADGTIWE